MSNPDTQWYAYSRAVPKYAAGAGKPRRVVQEELLVAAMLRRAYLDLWDAAHELRRDAKRWFASKENGITSFLWCCAVCGLEPDVVLRLIEHEPQEGPGVWFMKGCDL